MMMMALCVMFFFAGGLILYAQAKRIELLEVREELLARGCAAIVSLAPTRCGEHCVSHDMQAIAFAALDKAGGR